jgi:hypothetical protein
MQVQGSEEGGGVPGGETRVLEPKKGEGKS